MSGSSIPLRRLGAELRRLREATGRTQGDVATAIGRTHAAVVYWEHGRRKISKSDLVCLLAELRAPLEVRKRLEELRSQVVRGGWWTTYGLSDWLWPMVAFENDATEVVTFEPIVIPGLLQTRDYARAINHACPYMVPPDEAERWAAARVERQRRLEEPKPLRLRAVIAEAALRLAVGGTEVMADQLDRLLMASDAPNISIRVLRASAGAHASVSGNLTILRFAEPKLDPALGYVDMPFGGNLVDDEGDVAAMASMLDDVAMMSEGDANSREFIAELAAQYRKPGGDKG
jgi:transcriptional regulator with XRE-family HTH domain